MKFNQLEKESSENFIRLTGIKRATFSLMVSILNQAEIKRKLQGGKPNKLII